MSDPAAACEKAGVKLPPGELSYYISGAPRGAFQQPVNNKHKVRWLRILARPLAAVHNDFCLRN